MKSKKTVLLTAVLLLIVLAGCGRTVEEQTDTAIEGARETFEMNRKQPTESVEGIEFYKPIGFKADVKKEERTFTLSKRNQMITAEFDPNAKSDSQAFYELLMADMGEGVLAEQTFTDTGVFGFVVISAHNESSVQVVTGVGPVQIKAIVEKEDITTSTEQMMTIARSVQIDE